MNAPHIGTILIATGLLTMGAITLFLMPTRMLNLVFAVEEPDAVTRTITRHWGLLVFLIGGLLVFAGYHADVRVPVMTAAATEKLVIAALVLASPLRRRLLPVLIVSADALMAFLYVIALT